MTYGCAIEVMADRDDMAIIGVSARKPNAVSRRRILNLVLSSSNESLVVFHGDKYHAFLHTA